MSPSAKSSSLTRATAWKRVAEVSGQPESGVTKRTNILAVVRGPFGDERIDPTPVRNLRTACARHHDLIVPIVPRARTTAALDTVDCFFADPPFNLGKDYGTDVHDEHPEDHAVV